MLSRDSVKLLKWMDANDDWFYYHQLEENCPVFEYRAFSAIKEGGYIDTHVDESEIPEQDELGNVCYPKQYRINNNGKAYLEFQVSNRWKELRNWVSLFIAVAAFVKTFFLPG